jgi:hypothetical protein
MNMKWLKQTIVAPFCISVLVSCEYDYIEIAKPQPPDPGDTNNPIDTIFFATQIEPLFESNSCTGCHGGGFFLDLTPGNAYGSIMANGAAVAGDPDNSTIYSVPLPSGSHYKKYASTDESDLIYMWIFQGALDN